MYLTNEELRLLLVLYCTKESKALSQFQSSIPTDMVNQLLTWAERQWGSLVRWTWLKHLNNPMVLSDDPNLLKQQLVIAEWSRVDSSRT